MTIDSRRGGAGDLIITLWIAEAARRKEKDIKFLTTHSTSEIVRAFGFDVAREPSDDCMAIAGGSPSYEEEMNTAPSDLTPRVLRWQRTHGWDFGYERPVFLRDTISQDAWDWAEQVSKKNVTASKFVVISPQAHAPNRQIPTQKLLRLATSLRTHGIHWMAIGGESAVVKPFHPFASSGGSWSHVMALVSMADLVIGSDSGIAHMAATLGVKSLVIEGPTLSEIVYGHALDIVTPIKSGAPCAGCYYHWNKGYQAACNIGCEAIDTIPWFVIRDQALEILGIDGSSSKPGEGKLPRFRNR